MLQWEKYLHTRSACCRVTAADGADSTTDPADENGDPIADNVSKAQWLYYEHIAEVN